MKKNVRAKKPQVRISHKPFDQKIAAVGSGHCSSGNGCQSSCNVSSR